MINNNPYDINFICPNCGSKKHTDHYFYNFNKRNPDPLALLSDDPWVVVAEALSCASCKYTIPGHLGLRYGDTTLEEAKKNWEERYKNYPTNKPADNRKISKEEWEDLLRKIFNKPGELENFYKERRLKKLMRDNKIPPGLENFYSSRLKNK